MNNILNSLHSLAKKMVAPPFCSYCREYQNNYVLLCERCESHIKPVISTHIALGPYRMQVHAVTAYEDPLKTLVLSKSWSDYAAATKLGELLAKLSPLKGVHYDYIVPMPLHTWRFAYRGFNQVEVIAQQLSLISGIPILHCMERIKNTPFQYTFLKSQRHSNVKNAFIVKTEYLQKLTGKRILLLDDVMTTGSTLYEAGKTLISAEPSHLEALVVCRAIS